MKFGPITLAVVLFAALAQADELYAVSGSFGQEATLYKLDKNDGSVLATIGSVGFRHVTGIAFHPGTGELYGVVSDLYGSGYTQLISIDKTTGAGTAIGATGHQLPDIAFAPDGTLYGWSQIPGGPYPAGLDALVSIDLSTGAATQVGGAEYYTASTGLGIDPTTGKAWMKTSQGGASDSIWSIDLSTGLTVPVGDPSGDGPRFLEGATTGPVVHNMLAFDKDGVLYSGLRFGPQGSSGFQLYTIDLGEAYPSATDASVTFLGSNRLPYISGIAFEPVPEPGSLVLVAATAGAALLWRRRRRATR